MHSLIKVAHDYFCQLPLQARLYLTANQAARVHLSELLHVIKVSQHAVLKVEHPEILTSKLLEAFSREVLEVKPGGQGV